MKTLFQKPKFVKKQKVLDQKGQSLVEFILLLASILIISIGFLKAINGGMGNQWKAMTIILLEESNQTVEFR
jgi:hypothetical protein